MSLGLHTVITTHVTIGSTPWAPFCVSLFTYYSPMSRNQHQL